jgi:hypothetical protein
MKQIINAKNAVYIVILSALFTFYFNSTLVFEWGDIISNLENKGKYMHMGRDSAYMPPLYPMLLFLARKLSLSFGVYLLHLLIFIASFIFLVRLLKKSAFLLNDLTLDSNKGGVYYGVTICTLIYLLYPPVFYGYTRVSIFGISSLLFILYLNYLINIYTEQKKYDFILLGVISALMTLCRSEFLYAGLGILGFLLLRQLMNVRSLIRSFLYFFIPMALVLVPWIYRNYVVLGEPVLSTAKYYNLVRGNNLSPRKIPPITPEGLYPTLLEYEMSEVKQELFLKEEFFRYVQNNPMHFIEGVFKKMLNFVFSYYPSDGESYHGNLKHFLVYPWVILLFGVILSLISSVRIRRNILIQTLLFSFILYVLIHSLVQVLPRYNLQFIIVWLVIIFNYIVERNIKRMNSK